MMRFAAVSYTVKSCTKLFIISVALYIVDAEIAAQNQYEKMSFTKRVKSGIYV